MSLATIMPVVKTVLSDKRVIIVAILVFLYLDFVCYVVHYRKKPKQPRVRKVSVAPAPAPAAEGSASGGPSESAGTPAAAEKAPAAASSAKKK